MASKKDTQKNPSQTTKSTAQTSQNSDDGGRGNCANTDKSENDGKDERRDCKKQEKGKGVEAKAFKTRAMLEKELTEKSEQFDSLQQQLAELQEILKDKQAEDTSKDSIKKLYEATKIELAKAQEELKNLTEFKKKNSALSQENYNLRERLVKQEEEIARLKEIQQQPKPLNTTKLECESPMHKILRKENIELNCEKEQIKNERDRLKSNLKEKQDHIDKMSSNVGELQDQLLKVRWALEDRVKTSSRLEDRLLKMDEELRKYRERFGKLEKLNKRLSEKVKGVKANQSENVSDKIMAENKENNTHRTVALLQKKEEKLLQDRQQLEREVIKLSTRIRELEGQLRKCRPEKCPTNERGSQTELGPRDEGITTSYRQQGTALNAGESPGEANTVRKCRGIVKSLGKFFEELIQNQNSEGPDGASRGRRTAIAARRANELLHELSVSMEHFVSPGREENRKSAGNVGGSTKFGSQSSSDRQRSGGEGSLWDRVSREVAQHEFAFDQTSPAKDSRETESMNEKQKEVKRAEKALQRLYQQSSSGGNGKMDERDMLTKEDASRMMDVSRRQTEIVLRELLRKHHGEIRALIQIACQSSPIANMVLDPRDIAGEGGGQNEASLAVKELNDFKTRTAKVQSLILKLQAVVDSEKNDRESVSCRLQAVENELRQKDDLLQAKGLELRRRHCKSLETERSLQAQIESLTEEKERVGRENLRLQDVCRQKDLQISAKANEVKSLHKEIGEREKAHQQNLSKMRKKVDEAWKEYESLKMRAERRTAEFNDAAEKLKVSQGYLLDLWQTLKTVDQVAETNDNEEL